MNVLSSLKLVSIKREAVSDPKIARRRKLLDKLSDQIKMAEAHQSGVSYHPQRQRRVLDAETGERRLTNVPVRLKPWWWKDEEGKTYLTVRYGARILELQKGRNAIEVATPEELLSVLKLIESATKAGELDAQLASFGAQPRAMPKREILTLKKNTAASVPATAK